MNKSPEQNLKNLSITLNEVSHRIASYVYCVLTGNLLFLSGKGPIKKDNTYVTGKVGKDLTIEQGNEAARLVAIEN